MPPLMLRGSENYTHACVTTSWVNCLRPLGSQELRLTPASPRDAGAAPLRHAVKNRLLERGKRAGGSERLQGPPWRLPGPPWAASHPPTHCLGIRGDGCAPQASVRTPALQAHALMQARAPVRAPSAIKRARPRQLQAHARAPRQAIPQVLVPVRLARTRDRPGPLTCAPGARPGSQGQGAVSLRERASLVPYVPGRGPGFGNRGQHRHLAGCTRGARSCPSLHPSALRVP